MIVIRRLDKTGTECDQIIYCDMTCFEQQKYTSVDLKLKMHERLLIDAKYLLCNVYLGVTLNGCFLIEPNGTITGSEFPSLKDFLVVVKGKPNPQDYWICEHCEDLIDSRLQERAFTPYDAWSNGIQPYNKVWEKEAKEHFLA